jgi:hypothetical protein
MKNIVISAQVGRIARSAMKNIANAEQTRSTRLQVRRIAANRLNAARGGTRH